MTLFSQPEVFLHQFFRIGNLSQIQLGRLDFTRKTEESYEAAATDHGGIEVIEES